MFPRKSLIFGIVCLMVISPEAILAFGNRATTLTPKIATSPTSVEIHSLEDLQDLETFVDGLISTQLEEQHIAGVVVIVKVGCCDTLQGLKWQFDRRISPAVQDPA